MDIGTFLNSELHEYPEEAIVVENILPINPDIADVGDSADVDDTMPNQPKPSRFNPSNINKINHRMVWKDEGEFQPLKAFPMTRSRSLMNRCLYRRRWVTSLEQTSVRSSSP
jgi:hypothetical protein